MMDNEELLDMDMPVFELSEGGENEVIDHTIDEIEDAEEDINVGESLDDGDIIDSVALGKDAEPDAETIKFADDQEDDSNLIKAVQDGEQDPDDAAYEKEYPELHNDDPNDDGDDITEEDFEAISMDESGVNSDMVDIVLESREELENGID